MRLEQICFEIDRWWKGLALRSVEKEYKVYQANEWWRIAAVRFQFAICDEPNGLTEVGAVKERMVINSLLCWSCPANW